MKVALLIVLAVFALEAADERQIALTLQAQVDFDRVETPISAPQPRDALSCIQSQAAALSVAPLEERPILLFRKGYCTLAAAVAANDSTQFGNAALILDQAVEAWQSRENASTKSKVPLLPTPSPLRVFAAVARLEQSSDPDSLTAEQAHLQAAVDFPVCDPALLPPASCLSAIELGNAWLGWIALQSGDTGRDEARRRFSAAKTPGWLEWFHGEEAFRAADYPRAAADDAEALAILRKGQPDPLSSFITQLSPRPDIASLLTGLGESQLLSRDPAALATLDAAVKADPSKPHAIYLRARAKEAAGQRSAALADYDLASRTAYAAHPGQSSGEAHFYQGVLLYHRGDLPRAEDEFAGALNYNVVGSMRADAAAWRHLVAVAGGSCGASREHLEKSLLGVSPDFPTNDARSALAACGSANPPNPGQ